MGLEVEAVVLLKPGGETSRKFKVKIANPKSP